MIAEIEKEKAKLITDPVVKEYKQKEQQRFLQLEEAEDERLDLIKNDEWSVEKEDQFRELKDTLQEQQVIDDKQKEFYVDNAYGMRMDEKKVEELESQR